MFEKYAVLIMIKNEEKRILTTLNSLIKFLNFIILDTGSEDKTIDIIKDFCNKNHKNLFLKESKFVNFEISRNELLDFADSLDFEYYFLFDCNDEFKGDIPINLKNDGYLVRQEWYCGNNNIINYWNIKIIKSKIGWKFKGKVHEYLELENKNSFEKHDSFYIFQDRTKDDNKSLIRFQTDKKILLEEYNKNCFDSRTVYYLAQTFLCLDDKLNAIHYYKERIKLDGFFEEKYDSFYKLGILTSDIDYFFKALSICLRVEPLLRITEYYINIKNWNLAFLYCKVACELEYSDYILFVDKNDYDYHRWHLMGIIGFYCKKYIDGKKSCLKAIEVKNLSIDYENLKYYNLLK